MIRGTFFQLDKLGLSLKQKNQTKATPVLLKRLGVGGMDKGQGERREASVLRFELATCGRRDQGGGFSMWGNPGRG